MLYFLPDKPVKNLTRSSAKTALLLAFVSLVLAGCQSTLQKPGQSGGLQGLQYEAVHTPLTPELSTLVTNADLDSDKFVFDLYQFAQEKVAAHFDTDLQEVSLKLTNNAELERFVRRETGKLSNSVFNNPEFAEYFLAEVMEEQAGTYAGLYVSPENQIIINRELLDIFRQSLRKYVSNTAGATDEQLITKSILALLIHELVHAADNKRFEIHNRRDLNFRSSVAQSAVFEGHAQLATRELCTQLQCLEGLHRLDNFMFEAPEPADPVARSLQAVSRNVLEYAYVEGERFLHALQQSPGGNLKVEAALRNPPEDPVQILDPDNFPDQSRVLRNQNIFKQLASIEHPWNTSGFALIETSPIKGLDLRGDPQRRAATKEGFTRLIRSMVGAQLFNQQKKTIQPVEITVMQTDSEETADLFSQSFFNKAALPATDNSHSNTLHLRISERDPSANTNTATEESWPMRVFLTVTELSNYSESAENDKSPTHYVNLVANSGKWIIQMGGVAEPQDASMLNFSEQAMLALLSGK